MRKSWILFVALCLLLASACSKQITEEQEENTPEVPVDWGDDDGGDDDGGGSGGSGGGDQGGGNDDEGGSGVISTGDTVSVQQFLTLSNMPMVFVEGYVVGACSGSLSNAEFAPTFTKSTSILLADDIDETDVTKVVPVKRPTSKNVGVDLNLVTNPDLWHKKIQVPGYQDSYYGTIGITDIRGLCKIIDE